MSALLEEKPAPAEPAPAEMSVDEAAELLNVSAPYVERLMADGTLTAEGSPPRLPRADVLAYKKALRERQVAGMVELMALTEELGLYDLYVDATK